MSTTTPVLGLISNVPDDDFTHTDFASNWDTLDGSPGVFICTSRYTAFVGS